MLLNCWLVGSLHCAKMPSMSSSTCARNVTTASVRTGTSSGKRMLPPPFAAEPVEQSHVRHPAVPEHLRRALLAIEGEPVGGDHPLRGDVARGCFDEQPPQPEATAACRAERM